MVLLDSHRRHVDANGAYVRMLGYPREEILGVPASEYVAGGPLLTDAEWDAMLDGGPFTGEAGLLSAEGTVVAVQMARPPQAVTRPPPPVFCPAAPARPGGPFSP